MSLCPKCGGSVGAVYVQPITADSPTGGSWKAIAYLCPHCSTILGVSIDPIAIRTDILNAINKR